MIYSNNILLLQFNLNVQQSYCRKKIYPVYELSNKKSYLGRWSNKEPLRLTFNIFLADKLV